MARKTSQRVRREPPQYPAPLSVRLTDEQLTGLDRLADRLDRSRNSLIREGIDLVVRLRDEAVSS